MFSPTTKVLKINGEEITEGVSWSGAGSRIATYTIEKNGTYKIELELDGKKGTKTITLSNIYGNLGKYVKYDDGYDSDGDGQTDNELYMVLYDEGQLGTGKGAQIVSLNSYELENYHIGINDEILEGSSFYDKDGDGSTDFEKALASYNGIVESLNTKCNAVIKLDSVVATSVRNIGTNPTNPNSDNISKIDFSDSDYSAYSDTPAYTYWNNCIKDPEIYDTTDEEQIQLLYEFGFVNPYMFKTKIRQANYVDNATNAFINFGAMGKYFCMIHFLTYGTLNSGSTDNAVIQPVITLSSGALNNISGLGTEDEPYEFK